MSRSPNAGQTALTLQHVSGYDVPAGHNADGYTMAERVTLAKGGRAENPISRTTGKGGNYRKTKSGAGMTKKGGAAYRRANPGSKLKAAAKKGGKLGQRARLAMTFKKMKKK